MRIELEMGGLHIGVEYTLRSGKGVVWCALPLQWFVLPGAPIPWASLLLLPVSSSTSGSFYKCWLEGGLD